jgi:hypothetical protein
MSERAYGRLLDKCEKLEAENERLQFICADTIKHLEEAEAKIERLQAKQEFLLKIIEANTNEDILHWARHK